MRSKFKYLSYILIILYMAILDFALTNVYQYTKLYLNEPLDKTHQIYYKEFKKNLNTNGIKKEKYFTNSLGFRDFSNREVDLQSKSERILLMGDSATMGLYNDYENTYSGKITKYFEEKNIEVLNAAFTSYSPTIFYAKIKYLLEEENLEFSKLILFLDISDPFDDYYRYDLSQEGKVIDASASQSLAKKRKDIVEESFVNKTKKFLIENFTSPHILIKSINFFSPKKEQYNKFQIDHQNGRWNINNKDFLTYGKKGLKENKYYLDLIKKILDKRNIEMKLIIYPWPGTIYYMKGSSYYEEFWETWSKENNVDLLNFVEYFRYIKDKSKVEKLKLIEEIFFENDMHLNRTGNNLFYIELVKFLES